MISGPLCQAVVRHARGLVFALFCTCLIALLDPSRAADITWNPAQTGIQAWGVNDNWLAGIAAGALNDTRHADTAIFGTTSAATLITIDAGRNVKSLLFNGTQAGGLYTIGSQGINGGPALHLSSGGSLTVAPNTLTATTIHAPLILEAASATTAGTYTLANNATADNADPNLYKLILHGDIEGGTTTAGITLNLAGTAGNRNLNTSANQITGRISDGGAQGGLSLVVTGASSGQRGVWELTNNTNSFTGSVTITDSTLQFTSIANAGEASAIGAGTTLTIGSNSHVKYLGDAATTDRTIIGGGSFYNLGTGRLTLTGNIQLPGTLTFRGGQDFLVEGLVTGTGGLSRTDKGTVTLTQNNTFTGNISISDGAFRVGVIADSGIASPLGRGSLISLGQNSTTVGRLEFTGPEGGSTDREIRLNNGSVANSGNGLIDNTVAGQTLVLNGRIRAVSGTVEHTSSLNLSGVGNGVVNGIIGGTVANANASIALQLSKTGTGTWVLTAANHYNRGTLVSAGVLLVNNTAGSGTGSGSVITSGTGTLGGTGIIAGGANTEITIAANTRLRVGSTHGLPVGTPGAADTSSAPSVLTLGSANNVALTLAGTLEFDLYQATGDLSDGASDLLRLQTQAASIRLGGTIAVANVTGQPLLTPGAWQLIDWSGTNAATRENQFTYNFSQAPLASGYSWNTSTFLDDGIIRLTRSANHTWLGGTSSSWNTAANWEINQVPNESTDVFFNSAGGTQLSVALNGDSHANDFYFSGDTNYTIATGSGGVLYSHGTLLWVAGGSQRFTAQLRITDGAPSTFRIANEGTLQFDQSIMFHRFIGNDLTLTFTGSGDTTLLFLQRRTNLYDLHTVVDGPGSLTITSYTDTPAATNAAGSITGTFTLNGGTLRIGDERSLGSNPAAFNAKQLTFNGGTLTPTANLVLDDTNRGITLGSNGGTIDIPNSAHTVTLAVPITGSGSFSLSGSGRLVLESAANDFSGPTHVQGGILQIGRNGTGISGPGPLTIGEGAQLAGSGRIAASSFTLGQDAILQVGDILADDLTTNATLTFASSSTTPANYEFANGSRVLLSLTGPTNAGAVNGLFGGHAPGSPDYNALLIDLAGLNGGVGNHDRIVFESDVGATVYWGSQITVSGLQFVPAAGMVFNLIDWGSLVSIDFSTFAPGDRRDGSSDQYDNFDLPDISSYHLLWDVSLFTSHGIIAIIPEPSRATLILTALLLGICRRRR